MSWIDTTAELLPRDSGSVRRVVHGAVRQLIRRAVTDDQLPLRARAAACLMLIYAQPLTRICRLTIDDLT
ncbi:MAG: hypothetical protein ACRDQW_10655 [Haloechinothrix sp.]